MISTHLDDLYGYYYPPFIQTVTGKVVVIGLLVFFLLLILIFFLKKRKKRSETVWEWALQRLSSLDSRLRGDEMGDSKEDYKKLYFVMTETIKQYLAKRYQWQTQDKTDEELIVYLNKQRFDATLLTSLKKMLEGAVLIKFADESILKMQAIDDIRLAQEIVKKTKPSENRRKRP